MRSDTLITSTGDSYLPFNPWYFWLQWVLLNVLGHFALRYLFLEVLPYANGPWFEILRSSILVSGIVSGLVLGGIQWFLLRRYFEWPLAWIGASVIGYIVVDGWSSIADYWITPSTAMFVVPGAAIVAGVLLGTMQWVILRREVYRAGWWIVASGLSWFASSFISLLLSLTHIANNFVPYTIADRIAWIFNQGVNETILVVCLIWLLHISLRKDAEIERKKLLEFRL